MLCPWAMTQTLFALLEGNWCYKRMRRIWSFLFVFLSCLTLLPPTIAGVGRWGMTRHLLPDTPGSILVSPDFRIVRKCIYSFYESPGSIILYRRTKWTKAHRNLGNWFLSTCRNSVFFADRTKLPLCWISVCLFLAWVWDLYKDRLQPVMAGIFIGQK